MEIFLITLSPEKLNRSFSAGFLRNIYARAKYTYIVEPDDEKIIVEDIRGVDTCVILGCENISIKIYARAKSLDIIGCRDCSIYSFAVRNILIGECSRVRHHGTSSVIKTFYSERVWLYDNGIFHPEIYINNSLDISLNDRVIFCNPFIRVSFFFELAGDDIFINDATLTR